MYKHEHCAIVVKAPIYTSEGCVQDYAASLAARS